MLEVIEVSGTLEGWKGSKRTEFYVELVIENEERKVKDGVLDHVVR